MPDSGATGVVSIETPSKRGKGPAINKSIVSIGFLAEKSGYTIQTDGTYVAKPAHQTVCAQLVHVQSIVEQYQIPMESGDPCSPCLQAAISRKQSVFIYQRNCHPSPRATYLAKGPGWKVCLLEEWNSNLAGNNAEIRSIGDLE